MRRQPASSFKRRRKEAAELTPVESVPHALPPAKLLDEPLASSAPWFMPSSQATRYFGDAFVETMRARFNGRAAVDRPLTYPIAVHDEYEPWRRWFDEQLVALPASAAPKFVRRLWLDESFWPVIHEFATGAAIRAAGLQVAYEQPWGENGLTPDWMVLDSFGEPVCIVEVATNMVPQSVYGAIRQWHALARCIAKIPVPVVLVLEGGPNRAEPPVAGQPKRIANTLRRQMLARPRESRFDVYGYRFVVLANRFGPEKSPNGMYACFVPPSGTAGLVSAQSLADVVEEKVSKYRSLADELDIPLVTAVGAHKFLGLDVRILDDLLAGVPTFVHQFGIGDTLIGEGVIDPARPPRWTMPRELSGLLWISNDFPFGLISRPNVEAVRPMPATLATIGVT